MRRCDIVAIGAHPDDVELGCGGTLARLAAAGRSVAILDLTAGEAATRGDRATRAQEAEAAAAALGVEWRHCLGLSDGGLDAADGTQRTALVAALRVIRPGAVLTHHRGDPHPDHRAAADLVAAATFLVGVAGYGDGGAARRPGLILSFPGPRQLLEPSLVVDVSGHYDAKCAALAAHRSQFDPTWRSGESEAPATHLTSPTFITAIEGRDRAAGNTVGVEFGEGLVTTGPLFADALARLLAPGA